MSLARKLSAGIAEMGLEVSPEQQAKLLDYLALLHKWNGVYNLTAIRNPEQMVSHHLLDSLAVLPHLWPQRWLDVGCGAGLPGLVLAVMRPEWSFTLLDSNSKKTGFVQQAAIELGLHNVEVRCEVRSQWNSWIRILEVVPEGTHVEPGDFLCFSSAHLHGTMPNESQRTRFSVEVRTVSALDLPATLWWYVILLATLCTVLPTFLVAEALKRIGANHFAMIGALGPVTTVAADLALMQGTLSPIQIVGGVLVISGVLLVSVKRS